MGIVVGRCWWLVGQVVHVVMGVVGWFACVQVVVPFLDTSLSQFVYCILLLIIIDHYY